MSSLTSPAAKKRRLKAAENDARIEREIITALMRTGDGRRWVYRQLSASGIWSEDGSLDPQKMAWKAGLRNEGLRLLGQIHEYVPETYVLMWRENNARMKEEAAAVAADPQENEDG